MIKDKIITPQDIALNDVSSAPTRLPADPVVAKQVFDKLPELIAGRVNAVITDLSSITDGATNIGSPALKPNGAVNVGGQLAELSTEKVDKITNKGLSERDFTQIYETKLIGIEQNANNYSLPTASTTVLGGIKVDGISLVVTNGVASSQSSPQPDLVARAAIEQEVIDRQNADNAEATARTNADNALDTKINSIQVKMTRNPTVTDTGYSLGVQWVNTVNGNTYIRVNDEKIWRRIVFNLPDGSSTFPVNDKDIWLECADISSDKTLAQIVEDASLMTTLSTSSNAIDYMVRSTGEIMTACVGSVNAMTKLSPTGSYSMDEMIKSSSWASAILANANAITGLMASPCITVPTMTNYSVPSGLVFATSDSPSTSNQAWRAFNKSTSVFEDCWASQTGAITNQGIGYKFTAPVWMFNGTITHLDHVSFKAGNAKDIRLEYSDDGTSYTTASNIKTVAQAGTTGIIATQLVGKHLYQRAFCLNNFGGTSNIYVNEIQFYGK